MIVGLFPELLSPGGVQTAGRQTAAALALAATKRNVDCRFLSLNDSMGSHIFCVRGAQICFEGFGGNRARFIIAAIKAAFAGPTVTWAAHPNLGPIALAMKLKRPRMKVITCCHGVEVWRPLPPLRRLALHQSGAVVAPSRYTAQQIVTQQSIPAKRVHRLPWALDPAFESLAAAPCHGLPPGLPSGPMILTVGRWSANERYKGLDELIEAMPSVRMAIPGAFLAAVGDGDDRARLEQKAAVLSLQSGVRFFDAARDEQLVRYYKRCDVFALPSRGEGFGLVFLEAMALGKPLLGGAHGGIPDIVTHGVNGFLVAQDDRWKLITSLIELLRQPKLREQMGMAGLVRLRQDFAFERFAARVEEVLRQCGVRA